MLEVKSRTILNP